jgi:hypothetical protein
MIRPLQILHLSFLMLIPLAFTVLKLSANDYDPIIILTTNVSIILGVIWTSYFSIELIRTGTNDDLKPTLLKKYRNLIAFNLRFLVASNVILFFIFSILIYQFIAYRKVEFIATKNTELFESYADGTIEKVGDIPPNTIINFRVKTGIKFFLFRDPAKEEFTSMQPIEIPLLFSSKKIDRVKLIQDDEYEMLK